MSWKTFSKYGKGTNCVNEDLAYCDDSDEENCIGKEGANFVYQLQ
jgi:hypothetical protein